ncbi:MAG: polysaccharide biosynthesis/export family protein, partial [Deltaproteobacteria bacterium]|nr:polysaccharide biosynthesis/export family protein [Deltaproteobacteria bacterium]
MENDAQDYGKRPSLMDGHHVRTMRVRAMRHAEKNFCILMLSLALVALCAVAQAAEAPFAANLFQGNFAKDQRGEALVLEPGDRVVLRLWGEVNFDGTLVVDANGNIALPENSGKMPPGAIPVAGIMHGKLEEALKSKLAAAGLVNTQA